MRQTNDGSLTDHSANKSLEQNINFFAKEAEALIEKQTHLRVLIDPLIVL